MKKLSRRTYYCLTAIFCLFLSASFYVFEGRSIAIQLINGEGPDILTQLISFLYPRFSVEVQRLSHDFFLQKADQLIFRSHFLLLLVIFFIILYPKPSIKNSINRFWNKNSSTKSSKILIQSFYLVLFFFTKDWFFFLQEIGQLQDFYVPHSFYAVFNIPLLNETLLSILWVAYTLSIVFTILWIKPLWSTSIASILFIFLQGFLYSFEKTNHTFATLGMAVILLPFFTYYNIQSSKEGLNLQTAWPIVLIKLSVGFAYFQSGLEKILNSGFNWIYENSFLVTENTNSNIQVLATLVLLFQLSFIFFTWKNPVKWLFLAGGIVFHFSTVVFISVGAFLNPWIFMYSFWIIRLKNS